MKVQFIVLFCMLSLIGFGQNFSGELTYTITATPKSDSAEIPQQVKESEGTYHYLIMNGYYQSTKMENDKAVSINTYRGDTKMIYDQLEGVDYVSYKNSRKLGEETVEFLLHKDSSKKILRHNCYLLAKTDGEITKEWFYVSNKLKLNPKSFSTHVSGDWYSLLKASKGALPLYSKRDMGDYWIEMETQTIQKRKLSEAEFDIPKDQRIIPKASVLDEHFSMEAPSDELIDCMKSVSASVPTELRGKGLNGTVRFILHGDGSITDVTLAEKGNPLLDKAAVEMIQKCGMSLIPGKLNGKPADCEVILPLRF